MSPETGAVETVAHLMALSARTAPKAKGSDAIVLRLVLDSDLLLLADEMRRYGEQNGIGFFIRDSANIAQSDACVIIGSQGESVVGINCGGCGYAKCSEMLEERDRQSHADTAFRGPNCAVRMTDLGIALGSAVKTASMHNVDNRIMYSAGVGALRLGWLLNCDVAYGIPLKAAGKNIYFDRERKQE
jgi:uncharacterized ferredoxin-like protein